MKAKQTILVLSATILVFSAISSIVKYDVWDTPVGTVPVEEQDFKWSLGDEDVST